MVDGGDFSSDGINNRLQSRRNKLIIKRKAHQPGEITGAIKPIWDQNKYLDRDRRGKIEKYYAGALPQSCEGGMSRQRQKKRDRGLIA